MAIKGYHHFKYEDRCKIQVLMHQGLSKSRIAKQLSVHRSTIGREIKRNKRAGEYDYEQASALSKERRRQASSVPTKMTSNTLKIITKILSGQQ